RMGICPLSLHDALPICLTQRESDSFTRNKSQVQSLQRPPNLAKRNARLLTKRRASSFQLAAGWAGGWSGTTCEMSLRSDLSVPRSEEHTSELQSRENLV